MDILIGLFIELIQSTVFVNFFAALQDILGGIFGGLFGGGA